MDQFVWFGRKTFIWIAILSWRMKGLKVDNTDGKVSWTDHRVVPPSTTTTRWWGRHNPSIIISTKKAAQHFTCVSDGSWPWRKTVLDSWNFISRKVIVYHSEKTSPVLSFLSYCSRSERKVLIAFALLGSAECVRDYSSVRVMFSTNRAIQLDCSENFHTCIL